MYILVDGLNLFICTLDSISVNKVYNTHCPRWNVVLCRNEKGFSLIFASLIFTK